MLYDIIIPVAYRDYIFLKKTIKYIKKNLNANHIYIITHTDMLDIMPSSIKEDSRCIILDENAIIDIISYNKIKDLQPTNKIQEGKIFAGDIFDVEDDEAKYLTGENKNNIVAVKVLEVIIEQEVTKKKTTKKKEVK